MSFRKTLPPSGSGNPVSMFPPFAEIDQFCETRTRVSELAFVNDQAGVGAPVCTASKI